MVFLCPRQRAVGSGLIQFPQHPCSLSKYAFESAGRDSICGAEHCGSHISPTFVNLTWFALLLLAPAPVVKAVANLTRGLRFV